MFSGKRKIKIDRDLYRRLAQAAEQAGYSSTDEMIRHVLEREAGGSGESEDREQAEKQLRGLGYIE